MSSVRSALLRALILLITVASVVALPRLSSAQTTSGVIAGTVLDPQGAIVPGATVTVINEGTTEARTAVDRC